MSRYVMVCVYCTYPVTYEPVNINQLVDGRCQLIPASLTPPLRFVRSAGAFPRLFWWLKAVEKILIVSRLWLVACFTFCVYFPTCINRLIGWRIFPMTGRFNHQTLMNFDKRWWESSCSKSRWTGASLIAAPPMPEVVHERKHSWPQHQS